jgi:ribosome maturation protein SDO1
VVNISRGLKTYDKERVSFNLARLKTHGKTFEIVVDPDLAIRYKEIQKSGKSSDLDLTEIVKSEEIFYDASQGIFASETEINDIFGTNEPLEAAEQILRDGEIQITAEHRARIREQKRKKIVDIIHRNAIDPRTNNPHPTTRIETAMDEAKVKIDELRKAEEQVDDIVHKINPILPIKFEKKKIEVKVFADHAAQLYGFFKKWKILDESWNSDGSLSVKLEIPAGLQNDFFDKLNSMTQGGNETKILD